SARELGLRRAAAEDEHTQNLGLGLAGGYVGDQDLDTVHAEAELAGVDLDAVAAALVRHRDRLHLAAVQEEGRGLELATLYVDRSRPRDACERPVRRGQAGDHLQRQ